MMSVAYKDETGKESFEDDKPTEDFKQWLRDNGVAEIVDWMEDDLIEDEEEMDELEQQFFNEYKKWVNEEYPNISDEKIRKYSKMFIGYLKHLTTLPDEEALEKEFKILKQKRIRKRLSKVRFAPMC